MADGTITHRGPQTGHLPSSAPGPVENRSQSRLIVIPKGRAANLKRCVGDWHFGDMTKYTNDGRFGPGTDILARVWPSPFMSSRPGQRSSRSRSAALAKAGSTAPRCGQI